MVELQALPCLCIPSRNGGRREQDLSLYLIELLHPGILENIVSGWVAVVQEMLGKVTVLAFFLNFFFFFNQSCLWAWVLKTLCS